LHASTPAFHNPLGIRDSGAPGLPTSSVVERAGVVLHPLVQEGEDALLILLGYAGYNTSIQPIYNPIYILLSKNGNTQDLPPVVVHSWAADGFGVAGLGVVVVCILVVVVVFTTVVVGTSVGGFVGTGGDGVGGGTGGVWAGGAVAGSEGGGCVTGGVWAGGAVAGLVGPVPGNIVVVG